MHVRQEETAWIQIFVRTLMMSPFQFWPFITNPCTSGQGMDFFFYQDQKKSGLNLLFSNVCLLFVAADLCGREMSCCVVNIKFLHTHMYLDFQLMRAVFSWTVESRRSDAIYSPSIG